MPHPDNFSNHAFNARYGYGEATVSNAELNRYCDEMEVRLGLLTDEDEIAGLAVDASEHISTNVDKMPDEWGDPTYEDAATDYRKALAGTHPKLFAALEAL